MFTTFNSINGKMFLMNINFGEWLKQERERKKLTQSELGVKSSLHRSVINKIESSLSSPTPETLKALAHGLDMTPEQIYRVAGHLPPVPLHTEQTETLLHLFNQLTTRDKEDVIEYLRFRLRTQ